MNAKNKNLQKDVFFIKISTFGNHNAAIDDNGSLYTWGQK